MKITQLLWNHSTLIYETLTTPISYFQLSLKGSRIHHVILQVLKEMEKKKILLKPQFYVSDEFGCVENTVNIGVPFFLVDKNSNILDCMLGTQKQRVLTDTHLKCTIRHECGHAFFYAFRIGELKSAQKKFGAFKARHRQLNESTPYSPDFVDYLARNGAATMGYGQTHPEEDFADTFGACLDSNFNASKLQGMSAKKYKYVASLIQRMAHRHPYPLKNDRHKPYSDIKETPELFFKHRFGPFNIESFRQQATGHVDSHLKKVFLNHTPVDSRHIDASRFLERNKRWFLSKNSKSISIIYLQPILRKCIERSKTLHLTLAKDRKDKLKRIFSAVLVLLGTLLKENRRID